MTATGDWLWTGGYDTITDQRLKSTKLYTESGWQNFTELPETTGDHCQVYVENKGVYVIGGWNDEGSLDTTYELTSSNEWSKLSSLNTRRHDHACVEWEGGILAIGVTVTVTYPVLKGLIRLRTNGFHSQHYQ